MASVALLDRSAPDSEDGSTGGTARVLSRIERTIDASSSRGPQPKLPMRCLSLCIALSLVSLPPAAQGSTGDRTSPDPSERPTSVRSGAGDARVQPVRTNRLDANPGADASSVAWAASRRRDGTVTSSAGGLDGYTDRADWAADVGGSIRTLTFEEFGDGQHVRFALQSQGIAEVTGYNPNLDMNVRQFVTASESLPFPMFDEGTLPTEPNFLSNNLAAPLFGNGALTFHFTAPTTAVGGFIADGSPLGDFTIELFDEGVSLGVVSLPPRTLPDSFVGVVSSVPFTSARFRPEVDSDAWGIDCVEHASEFESDCGSGQFYDDGEGETGIGWNPTDNVRVDLVVPFTPPEYPYVYDQMCLTWTQTSGDDTIAFRLVMFDDDGPNGTPGTQLASLPASSAGVPLFPTIGEFESFELNFPPVDDGVVFLGVEWDPSVEQEYFVGADTDADFLDYHRVDLGTWVPDIGTARTPMIRVDGFGTGANAFLRKVDPNTGSLTTASSPRVGAAVELTVDVSETGHAFALLAGSASAAHQVLPAGQVLLVDLLDPAGELLGLPSDAGPEASFQLLVPNDTSLVGATLAVQAAHYGGAPFALSNALDLALGL